MAQKSLKIRATAKLPVILRCGRSGDAKLIAFKGVEHVAMVFDPLADSCPEAATLVRLHSRCATSESLGSRRCDCAQQLEAALERMVQEGGILIYMEDEGRGIGLSAKVHAYQLQDSGSNTFEANAALGYLPDQRDFTVAGEMLAALGVRKVRLLTQNFDKVEALRAAGIVVEAIETTRIDESVLSAAGREYLRAKTQAAAFLRHAEQEAKQ